MTGLYDGQGRPVALGARLGRGGEGEVFEVAGQPGLVAKVLHPDRRQGKHAKVQAMAARPPAGAHDRVEGYPVLTWPRDLLHSAPGRPGEAAFRGYTMARVPPHGFVPFHQVAAAARRRGLGGPPVTWDRLVLLGLRLCHLLRTLHRFGYAVGDLNDRNVLVSRRLTPLLMDTDSFQVPRPGGGHFPSIVGDALYWPPELLDVDFATYRGDREPGDRHALGVLLFQLFMDGMRPYQARGSAVDGLETLADKTRAGHYPWARPRPGVLEPPASAPDYRALPRAVRHAFERCFVDGHRRPARRPSADEWYAVLAKVHAAGYRACPRDARHVHAAELPACPWCGDRNDPFGASRRPARLPRPAPAPRLSAPSPQPAAKPSRRPGASRRPPPQHQPASAKPQPPRPKAAPPRRAAAKPSARKPKPSAKASRSRRRTRVPKGAGRVLYAAWLAALLVAFTVPTLLLLQAPLGVERKAVTLAAPVAMLTGLGARLPLPRLPRRRARLAAAALCAAAALGAALALAALGRWDWLAYATGAAGLAAGAATFLLLERRAGGPSGPTPRGLAHGAAALPAAYLPAIAVWAWLAA